MEKKTLGAFIALLRKEKGLTQKQLAELLNVSDKTVSHWECDETSPDISLLPPLAKNLGVTVDELLQGEKIPVHIPPQLNHNNQSFIDKAEQYTTKTVNKKKENANGSIAERYKLFRLLSLIGTVASLVVLVSVGFATATSASFGAYIGSVSALFLPGITALFGSLWTIAISLGFTIGARYYFSKELRPRGDADEREREYVYRANAFSYNNIFIILCILPVPLIGLDILPPLANALAVVVILAVTRLLLTVILSKKGVLRSRPKKLFKLKFISVFILSAVIVSGSLLIFREVYYPDLEAIYFDTSAEFIAYMETPKPKPDNAYIVEGVLATTHPPTMPVPGNEPAIDSPVGVGQISSDFAAENVGESVLGYCNGELITFKWLNNEVSDCTYLENEGSFQVITFEAEIRQKEKLNAVEDNIPVAAALFCIADAVACIVLYKRKTRETEQ